VDSVQQTEDRNSGAEARAIAVAPASTTNLDEIAYRESIWRLALENCHQGVWDYNCKTQKHFVCDGWKRMRGLDPTKPFHDTLENWLARVHEEDRKAVETEVLRHNAGKIPGFRLEYREQRADGSWAWILAQARTVQWNENGKPQRLVGTDLDITRLKAAESERAIETKKAFRHQLLELKRANREAEKARKVADKLSRVDPLSGLANRRAFTEKLQAMVSAPEGDFSLFLVDLNHFKEINDELGHNFGDAVIVEVARRLSAVATKCSMVARLGGDEFGLIVPDPADEPVCETDELLSAISNVMAPQFALGLHCVALGASIGVARYPEHAKTSSELLRLADIALYEAKARGRCPSVIFDEELGQKAAKDSMLSHDLRKALDEFQISPHFQPISNLRTGETVRMEALARWNHPLLGRVGPDEFIPIAERLRVVQLLTECVVTQALQVAAEWPTNIGLSINISADEMCTAGTGRKLLQLLRAHGFPPERLQVEIIEQALLKDVSAASQEICTLRRAGVGVFLDDFGKGFSGLHYLRELSVDGIKIDGAFAKDLDRGNMGWKVLNGLIDLARSMSLAVVVEGIEDKVACAACQQMGVQFGQGYFIARPMAADHTKAFLQSSNFARQTTA
jgi:diguanylate cyclase (GGDEF)-like protein/PAS domain S-box-containing protein